MLTPIFENIPTELTKLNRWVTWRAEGSTGEKPRKVPYSPDRPQSRASSTDPDTWGTFDQSEAAYIEGDRAGVGFVLNGDGLVGIDIDHCFQDGQPLPKAIDLLNSLGAGYIEVSPSGEGLRGFGYATPLDKGAKGVIDGLDIEVYSQGRYLTLTGHSIKQGVLTPLQGFGELAQALRPTKQTIDPVTGQTTEAPMNERHSELVRRILTGEAYHLSLRDMAASLVAAGLSAGAAVEHLRGLMDSVTAPHDERWTARRAQIPHLVTSAAAKFDRPIDISGIFTAPNEPLYKLLTAAELDGQPDLEWRVRDVLPATGLAMILGKSGDGKTFVGLDLAGRIATGMEWNGYKVTQSPVIYLGLEGERGIKRRVKAWENTHGQLPDTMRFVLQPFNMLKPSLVKALADIVIDAGLGNGVLIIDTLARAIPGCNENDSKDMGQTIEAATQLQMMTGALIILIHHMGKDTTKGGRGHSSLYAALDAAIAVSKSGNLGAWTTDSNDGGKAKDGQATSGHFELRQIELGTDADGHPITSAVAHSVSDEQCEPVKTVTPRQQEALDAYERAAREHGQLDRDERYQGLSRDHWRAEFYERSAADSPAAKQRAFARAAQDLVTLGRMQVSTDIFRMSGIWALTDSLIEKDLRQKKDAQSVPS